MSIESLTYAELGDRLGTTQEAARSLARRLRLPRHAGNDGKARITIDLTEINYRPLRTRSPGDHRSDSGDLSARIEQLEGELARVEVEKQCLEVRAASHRADFERERERRHARNRELCSASLLCRLAKKPRDWTVSSRQPGPIAVGGVG